jgi:lipoic acid synthetase
MFRVRWLGRVEYRESLDLQRQLFHSSDDDHLLLLEHPHVFTGGPNTDLSHLLVEPSKFGATYEQTDRGGDITYHGPGQLTGYPILSLPGRRGGGIAETKTYIHQLEQVLIGALSELGLDNCGRLERHPGVWVHPANERPRKIAAVGVRLSRGRTMHGFALNVATDLSWFDCIIPCGIEDYGVTSLENEGINASMERVVQEVSKKAIENWGATGSEFAATAFPQHEKDLDAFKRSPTSTANDEVKVLLRERKTTDRRQRRLQEVGVSDGLPITNRKPSWMKAHIDLNDGYRRVRSTLRGLDLTTVCEEAGCPNIYECWGKDTATFMINGNRCTRACGFCLVDTRHPAPLDEEEPQRVAKAITAMSLDHVVITAVARDDLTDGGASGFINTIKAIRVDSPSTTIETLIPDFGGKREALQSLVNERPDVINHNLETVARLQRAVRPSAGYARSLTLLARVKGQGVATKSGLITGLGESDEELLAALADLAAVGVDIVTIGQYLRPSPNHLPVQRWVAPETFEMLADHGRELGIAHIEAGPLTRSSYNASDSIQSLVATQ